jgi:4-hydroxy-3-polyprenylbenzoate decarboxylase
LVRNLALALKALRGGMIIKNLIVVDDDIDVHNMNEVLWAWCVRFQPSKDITIIPNTQGVFLDPSEKWTGMGRGTSSFAIYDCTEKPAPYDEGFKRGRAIPSPEIMKKVEANWKNYGFK